MSPITEPIARNKTICNGNKLTPGRVARSLCFTHCANRRAAGMPLHDGRQSTDAGSGDDGFRGTPKPGATGPVTCDMPVRIRS